MLRLGWRFQSYKPTSVGVWSVASLAFACEAQTPVRIPDSGQCASMISCSDLVDPDESQRVREIYGADSRCWTDVASAADCTSECDATHVSLGLKSLLQFEPVHGANSVCEGFAGLLSATNWFIQRGRLAASSCPEYSAGDTVQIALRFDEPSGISPWVGGRMTGEIEHLGGAVSTYSRRDIGGAYACQVASDGSCVAAYAHGEDEVVLTIGILLENNHLPVTLNVTGPDCTLLFEGRAIPEDDVSFDTANMCCG